MSDPNESTAWIAHPVVWAAGLAGALVSAAHMQSLSLRQRLVALVCGLLTAGFVTPAAADHFEMSQSTVGLTGFVLGLIGMSATAGITSLATKLRNDPESAARWIAALFGRNLPPLPPAPPLPPPAEGGEQPKGQ